MPILIDDPQVVTRIENAAAAAGTTPAELVLDLIVRGLGSLSHPGLTSPSEMKQRLDALAMTDVHIASDRQGREYIYE